MRRARARTAPRSPAFRKKRCAEDRPLPFAGARQLLDPANDEILLQPAQAIDEDGALEVIDLVLKAAREQARGLDDLLLTVTIEPFEDRARWTRDRRVEPGHAEAAFLFELHAVA